MSAPVDREGPASGAPAPLDALLIEDSATDASLVVRELRRSGFEGATNRVDSADELRAALSEGSWDVVLSDHLMPGFDSTRALEIIADLGSEVPLILVSGTIGEDAAVGALQRGAADYVDKDHLERLGPAVRHTLREADARRAQREAEEDAARQAAIVESSHDAILGATLDGTILDWNLGAEELYGYGADVARGRNISLLAPPHLHNDVPELFERVTRGERIEQFEAVHLAKDGRLVDVSLTISPVKDRNDRVVGASTIARDITERKRAEEQLHNLDRLKDEFLSTVSHELRTPLTAIGALAEVLRGTAVTDPEERAELLGRILQNSAQMSTMIEQLLDYSRLEAGKVSVKFRPLALREAALHCIDLAGSAVGARQISLEIPDDLKVRADQHAFERILGNLLTNAAKFSAEASTIRVTARAKHGEATIAVEDQGTGIPPEEQAKIFERFYQNTVVSGARGTGIGLSIVRRYVELLGGKIWVESEPGRGSTFLFTLKLSAGKKDAPG